MTDGPIARVALVRDEPRLVTASLFVRYCNMIRTVGLRWYRTVSTTKRCTGPSIVRGFGNDPAKRSAGPFHAMHRQGCPGARSSYSTKGNQKLPSRFLICDDHPLMMNGSYDCGSGAATCDDAVPMREQYLNFRLGFAGSRHGFRSDGDRLQSPSAVLRRSA